MNTNKNGPPSGKGGDNERYPDEAVTVFYDKDGNIRQEKMEFGAARGPSGSRSATPPPAGAAKKAKPASGHTKSGPDASAEEYAEDIADLIEEKFMGLLKQRLAENDGHLSADDVEEMGVEFREQIGEIRTIFLDAVKSFTKAKHRSLNEDDRKNTFHRLMVHRFEDRLAPDSALEKSPDRLSRRMLPGFFSVLSMMVGQDNLARFRKESDALAERLKVELGDAFEWSEVYKSKEGRRILLRAEMLMARNFTDVDKRVHWLIAFINGNLIAVDQTRPGAAWTFSETAARDMLRDLFTGIKRTLNSENGRDALSRSLDDKGMAQLQKLVAAVG